MDAMQGKILITGGAGFIGSQLGHHLTQQGHRVVLLDNMSYGHLDNLIVDGKLFGEFACCDIRSPELARWMKDVDVVYHFAGIAALPVCQANPQLAYDINTSGTGNVLEMARLAGVRRVVFSSTSALYENSKTERQREDEATTPNLVYSMTKQAAEDLCRAYATNYGMDIVVTRFFNVYGPHQDFKRKSPPFTGYIARELAAGRAPKLFNRTDAKRDYIYVTDVIDLLVKMAAASKRYAADVFNVGSGEHFSVPDLYERMRKIAGKEVQAVYEESSRFWDAYESLFVSDHPLSRERVTKEVYKNNLADTTKTTREFGWTSRVGIDAGLRAVYEYAVKHG